MADSTVPVAINVMLPSRRILMFRNPNPRSLDQDLSRLSALTNEAHIENFHGSPVYDNEGLVKGIDKVSRELELIFSKATVRFLN